MGAEVKLKRKSIYIITEIEKQRSNTKSESDNGQRTGITNIRAHSIP